LADKTKKPPCDDEGFWVSPRMFKP
jgi:hypothetical protein